MRNLEVNAAGVPVWHHHFDWEYRSPLVAPWYSGLAQGQGISLLARAYVETRDPKYTDAAEAAYNAFLRNVDQGGVVHRDADGGCWFEEYIVAPPTHILNGFIWASWGVYDYFLLTRRAEVERLFTQAVATIATNLPRYDAGFWSLYEQSGTRLKMLASPFYHRLHVAQLKIMYRITGQQVFSRFAQRWQAQLDSRANRTRAIAYKSVFKLCYY